MSKLFEDSDFFEMPSEFENIGLDGVEEIVLKVLAFINHPFSKYETKSIVKAILDSKKPYSKIKKGEIDKSIEGLIVKNILKHHPSGFVLDQQVVSRIIPLAKDNLPLVKMTLSHFTSRYLFSYNTIALPLSILANDFVTLDKLTNISKSYSWSRTELVLRDVLLKLDDMALIAPMLPYFHENIRSLFLNTLPFSLHYKNFEQLKEIYLHKNLKLDTNTKYIYASCANLILPANEVVEITKALGLPNESLFFCKLLQGDSKGALIQGSEFLIDIQEKEGHNRKELPGVYGLLYSIVLLSTGDYSNFGQAATFIRSAIKLIPSSSGLSNPFKSFGQIMLLFINHKLGKTTTSSNVLSVSYGNEFHQYFLTAVLNWFGRPMAESIYPDCNNEKEEFEYRAAGLIGQGDSAAYSDTRLKELRTKFGTIPLAELYKPEEVWEDVLTILANELSKNKNHTKGEKQKKRLIWLIDPLNMESLTCLEQVRNKSGWSSGKERSLFRMISSCPDFATKEDQNIISCLQKEGYGSEIYVKDRYKLLQYMAVHPEVYTVSKPHFPLRIRIEEAQIQIDKNKGGATIKLNPKSPESRITKETPTSYIYTNWSAKAMQVYNVLRDSKLNEIIIPESGMAKAKPVLDRLSDVMPIAGNLTQNSGKRQKSANIPVFQLTPVNDKLHVQLLIEVLKDEEVRFVPGIGSAEVLVKNTKGQSFNIIRDRTVEKEILSNLIDRIAWMQEMKSTSAQLFIDSDEDILDFLAQVKENAPEVKMIWPKGERMRVAKVVSHADLNINIKKSQDWFAIDGDVAVDNELMISVQQLLDKSKGGTLKYVQLDDKTYLSICSDLQKRLGLLDSVAHKKGKALLVHALTSSSIEKFVEGIENIKTDKLWKQHLEKLEHQKSYLPSLPDNLKAELRPYQREGVLWLDRLHHWGVGACLADDMGLGKTIQAISILLKYAKNGPSLVLAPASVCNNWIKELIRFAPTMNPLELKSQNREEALKNLGQYDVLVVSYGIVQSNPDLLEKQAWNIVVLDEAHAIKNAKSVRSKAVMKLDAKFRIITTGTPIQNHLGELWNLFQFINPGMLGSSEQFAKKFVKNGNALQGEQSRHSLNRLIAPFILRRNKNEVLDDLPAKTEITLQVPLSEQERAMYEVLRQEAIAQIAGSEVQSGAKHLQILAQITKLRQMSCHPKLVVPDSDIPSSKLEALEMLIDDLLDANHKALVFSQFTKHLALICDMLDKKGVSYQYLDGSTPIKKREIAIDDFQNGRSDLFLISLKAGGVGLNLTAADYVIHMDPWWNPAVEDQASDRAHRIGQTRPVTIYRIIAENTIEEKIVKMHHDKRDLADKLLADTDQSAKISSEELLDLIIGDN